MKVYFRLWSFLKPYRRFLVPFFFFTLIAVGFNVLQFTLIIPLLKFLFDPVNAGDAAKYAAKPEFQLSIAYFKELFQYYKFLFKAQNPVYVLYFLAITIVVAVICTNLFNYLANRTLLNARTTLVKKVREALYVKINTLHIGYFTKESKGDLLTRLNTDVYTIEAIVADSVKVVFKEPYLLVGYFIALFSISVKLTLFTLIIVPVSAFGISLITRKLKEQASAVQSSMGNLLTIIDETLGGMRIIRSFNASKFFINRFSKENDNYQRATVQSFYRRELAPAFSETSGVFIVACILVYGGSLVLNKQSNLEASSFIAFIAIFSQLIRPAKAIVVAITNIQQGRVSAEKILEILDKYVEVAEKTGAIDIPPFNNIIQLNNVSFAYNETPVLKNISFAIMKGQKVALVGPSGVGKSTIADLIPRFYDVSAGSITIDGVDVRNATFESLRQNMSFVSQDVILFNDTIFNNIALGKPDASPEEVEHAARVANAHEFIMNTENGYQTNIGDRGLRLSGGQRQRLSIARAVFKNAPLLILDEATSALDTESEKAVQKALDNLMEGRTALIIAHRLSTIKEADEILIMEGGEIIERGSHKELVEMKDGIYLRLTRMQNVN